MSEMQKKVDKQIKQLRLFDQPSLNIVARLKAAMRQALSESKFSREGSGRKNDGNCQNRRDSIAGQFKIHHPKRSWING